MLVAWRQRGYIIVYLTGLSSTGVVGPDKVPLPLAVGAWQQRKGFPVGEGTRLLMWDQAAFADVTTYRIDAMVHLSLEGVDLDHPGTALDRSGHPNPVPRIASRSPGRSLSAYATSSS